jgi:GntR family transcriptional regulator/MocR family aminotransferase
MYLQLDRKGATYEQLARTIQAAIRKGRIATGDKLPPSRELASQLRVSRNTIVSAYELLSSQQWVRSRHGSGTFVLRAPRQTVRARNRDGIPPSSRYSARLRNTPHRGPGARDLVRRVDEAGEVVEDQQVPPAPIGQATEPVAGDVFEA